MVSDLSVIESLRASALARAMTRCSLRFCENRSIRSPLKRERLLLLALEHRIPHQAHGLALWSMNAESAVAPISGRVMTTWPPP